MFVRQGDFQFDGFGLHGIKVYGVSRTFYNAIFVDTCDGLPLALCIFIIYLPAFRYTTTAPGSIVEPIYGGA